MFKTAKAVGAQRSICTIVFFFVFGDEERIKRVKAIQSADTVRRVRPRLGDRIEANEQ